MTWKHHIASQPPDPPQILSPIVSPITACFPGPVSPQQLTHFACADTSKATSIHTAITPTRTHPHNTASTTHDATAANAATQVCDLREKRLDEEELIAEFTKTIDALRKDKEAQAKKQKLLEQGLAAINTVGGGWRLGRVGVLRVRCVRGSGQGHGQETWGRGVCKIRVYLSGQ